MSPGEHALGPSMCERAQAKPSIEVRAEVFVRIEPDRAGGDRIRQAQTPKPHRGQRREVGIDDEIDVEALIGETQIDGRRLDAQPEGTPAQGFYILPKVPVQLINVGNGLARTLV